MKNKSLASIRLLLFAKTLGSIIKDSTGSTYNRGDYTSTNAFFWSSLDLSSYAGTDLGYTPFRIRVLDAAGKVATGYLAAVGAGETLGSELLVNGNFNSDTTGWTGVRGTIASIAGGQNGNCLELTRTSDADQFAKNVQSISSATNKLFKFNGYVKSGTSGNELSYIRIVNYADTLVLTYINATSSGTWTAYPDTYLNAIDNGFEFDFWKNSATPGTMLFDTGSIKQVTDPPATAVHIVSSLNGTTRAWESIESGFDPNSIVSWGIYT